MSTSLKGRQNGGGVLGFDEPFGNPACRGDSVTTSSGPHRREEQRGQGLAGRGGGNLNAGCGGAGVNALDQRTRRYSASLWTDAPADWGLAQRLAKAERPEPGQGTGPLLAGSTGSVLAGSVALG